MSREDARGAERRISQRAALGVGFVALLMGAAFGAAGDRLLGGGDSDTSRSQDLNGGAAVPAVPAAPLELRGRTLRLGAGAQAASQAEGAVTITIVRRGLIEVEDASGSRRLGPGELVVEGAGEEIVLRAEEDSTLDVIQLAPEGAGDP